MESVSDYDKFIGETIFRWYRQKSIETTPERRRVLTKIAHYRLLNSKASANTVMLVSRDIQEYEDTMNLLRAKEQLELLPF